MQVSKSLDYAVRSLTYIAKENAKGVIRIEKTLKNWREKKEKCEPGETIRVRKLPLPAGVHQSQQYREALPPDD